MPYAPRPAAFDFSGIFTRPPPATLALMIATGLVSLTAMVGARGLDITPARLWLDFAPSQLLVEARFWTPFTYLFIAATPLNLLFYEVFGLWMFGSRLEALFGTRRYLFYFFATGAGGALLTTVLALALPPLATAPPTVFHGTWVALDAILLGWVLMNWNATVYLLFFPVRAPVLLALAVAIPFLYVVMGYWEPFVPTLLGMAIGYLLMRKRRGRLTSLIRGAKESWAERQFRRKSRHLKIVRADERPPGPPRYLN